jgi:hypothetical protein
MGISSNCCLLDTQQNFKRTKTGLLWQYNKRHERYNEDRAQRYVTGLPTYCGDKATGSMSEKSRFDSL